MLALRRFIIEERRYVAGSMQNSDDLNDVNINLIEHEIVSESQDRTFAKIGQSGMIEFVSRPSRGMFADLAVGLIHRIVKPQGRRKVILGDESSCIIHVRIGGWINAQAVIHGFLVARIRRTSAFFLCLKYDFAKGTGRPLPNP